MENEWILHDAKRWSIIFYGLKSKEKGLLKNCPTNTKSPLTSKKKQKKGTHRESKSKAKGQPTDNKRAAKGKQKESNRKAL